MHEVSLLESALELARAEATRQGARRIHRLTLRIGAMAGVVPEALSFAFEVVTQGTLAEGATLEVIDVPLQCVCELCAHAFSPPVYPCECPRCGHPRARVAQGRELELASLEVS